MNFATTQPAAGMQQMSESMMQQFTDLIYETTGIRIPQQKRTLMSNRVRRRLRATGCGDYQAYFQHLKSISRTDKEWDGFLQEITTHETYLFRDEAQWNWLKNTFLPGVVAAARKGDRPRSLRIWSAAASTGDESYSIATCIAASIPNHTQWNIKILGTDIGIDALRAANEGNFGERAMRLVPKDLVRRFFKKSDDGQSWSAQQVLRDMLEFRQHNLLKPLGEKPFDLVFLKNVLIYFDRDSKKRVMELVNKQVTPGGYLVSGPAEGISDFVTQLERHEPWLFQSPPKSN